MTLLFNLDNLNFKNKTEQSLDWNLILVNDSNFIPDDFTISLKELKNQVYVDERIYPDLQNMFDDARRIGLYPVINSAYRQPEEQQAIFNDKIATYMAQGSSKREAKVMAQMWVAEPGTSEHQTGLALDIISEDRNNTDIHEWLKANSYKYGFILRYPPNKTEITGISHEPWHFRYVGIEAATEIYNQGLSLEEYIANLG